MFGLVWSGLGWFGLVVVFGWSVGFGFVFVLTGFFESWLSLWLAHQPSGQAILELGKEHGDAKIS